MINDDIGTGCDEGGDEDDHDYEDITVTDTNPNTSVYLIKSLKEGQATQVTIGQTVDYIITVYNTGATDAVDYIVKDRFEDASSGALALAPKSLSTWTVTDGMAVYNEAITIPAGGNVSQEISFVITDTASGSVRNFAIVCPDDDPDCGEDIPPVNPVCPVDNPDCCEDVFEEGNPYGCVEVEIIEPGCESLVATPNSSNNGTLNTTLTCTAQGANSYKIIVQTAGMTYATHTGATWNLTGLGIGEYTAKCYIDDEDTTTNACTTTLSVTQDSTPPGGGGGVPACLDIEKSGNTITCYGNNKVKNFYVSHCDAVVYDADGNITQTSDSEIKAAQTVGGRTKASFNCSNITAATQCHATRNTSPVIGQTAFDSRNQCILTAPVCGNAKVDA